MKRRTIIRANLLDSIVGWKNVRDENGKPIPFSRTSLEKFLSDLPDLAADISSAIPKQRPKTLQVNAKRKSGKSGRS